jgi:uncharacterized protein
VSGPDAGPADGMVFLEHPLVAGYERSAGAATGRFLTALRDERVLLGRRCATCRQVTVPPTERCEACGGDLRAWVPVGPGGVVTGCTVVCEPLPLAPRPPPYAVLRVRLDGADTDLVHLAAHPGAAGLMRGARVTARWAARRSGTILDLEGFVPEADGVAPDGPTPPGGGPVTAVAGRLDVPVRQTIGPVESRFHAGVRAGLLHGNRCRSCAALYVPPRSTCSGCWTACEGWEPVPDTGTVTTHVVVNVPFAGQEVAIPYVLAHVLLDGAGLPLTHLVGLLDATGTLTAPAAPVTAGLRVRAVWRPPAERTGFVNDDILCFEPVERV